MNYLILGLALSDSTNCISRNSLRMDDRLATARLYFILEHNHAFHQFVFRLFRVFIVSDVGNSIGVCIPMCITNILQVEHSFALENVL